MAQQTAYVVAFLLILLPFRPAQSQTASLAGDWSGQSICGVGNPSCHDEYVVYRISVDPLDATKVKIAADKIVEGKLEWMGDVWLKYDAAKQTLTGDLQNSRVKRVLEFAVKGDLIEGTLSIFNPEKTVGRRIRVQKNGTSQQESSTMKSQASGTFDVRLTPQDDKSDDKSMGRMSIEKQWHGDLEGTSKGQMLTGGDATKGSAGYVAIEKFTGALRGRKGSFILQHTATMTKGTGDLTITVVPDSGTEELKGITGRLTIKIENGKHFFDFEYGLP